MNHLFAALNRPLAPPHYIFKLAPLASTERVDNGLFRVELYAVEAGVSSAQITPVALNTDGSVEFIVDDDTWRAGARFTGAIFGSNNTKVATIAEFSLPQNKIVSVSYESTWSPLILIPSFSFSSGGGIRDIVLPLEVNHVRFSGEIPRWLTISGGSVSSVVVDQSYFETTFLLSVPNNPLYLQLFASFGLTCYNNFGKAIFLPVTVNQDAMAGGGDRPVIHEAPIEPKLPVLRPELP